MTLAGLIRRTGAHHAERDGYFRERTVTLARLIRRTGAHHAERDGYFRDRTVTLAGLIRRTLAATMVAIAGCAAWSPRTAEPISHAPSRGHLHPSVTTSTSDVVLRSQDPSPYENQNQNQNQNESPVQPELRRSNPVAAGSDNHFLYPMAVSGKVDAEADRSPTTSPVPSSADHQQVQYNQAPPPPDANSLWSFGAAGPSASAPPNPNPADPNLFQGPPTDSSPFSPPPAGSYAPGASAGMLPQGPPPPGLVPYGYPLAPTPGPGPGLIGLPSRLADIIVNVQETQTGRIMLGAGVNSDAGVTGQIIVDERNFDWQRYPTSIDDILNGTAFRGAGQGFRLEALPGQEVQRYLVQFTEPYLGGTMISFSVSGYMFDRRYFDWDEQRLGGRLGLGYRLTPDLSLSVGVRAEDVRISDPRVPGVPELDAVLGDNSQYVGQVSLAHDTRDIPFSPTEGHLLELSYSQAFGDFDFPRGDFDFRQYYLLTERVDGSGRHVLGVTFRTGLTGTQTPIYENYFAGGHATLRGFEFREASPRSQGVVIGGEFLMLGSVEYLFPITGDDMLKGVLFCDYGTVEEKVEINSENFRVALGGGLRIFIPAMGPAPIALDFAAPVARANSDRIENFSFFVGIGR